MTRDDVLEHVVRAAIDVCEKRRRSLSEQDLAAELGVEEHHVVEALRNMATRKWCAIGADNQVTLAGGFLAEMKSFVNPLPRRPQSDGAARVAVASEILRRIRNNEEFTLPDIAAAAGVPVGRVRSYINVWNDEIGSEEFMESPGGYIDWNGFAIDHLEAAVDCLEPNPAPLPASTSIVINATNVQNAVGGHVFGGEQSASITYGSQSSDDTAVSAAKFKGDISEALALLAKDMDTLGASVEEALSQFLRSVRSLDVDGKTVRDVRDMVEDLWLERQQEKLQLNAISASGVGKALLQSVILKGIVGAATAGLKPPP